jgi:hypothetical protein
MRTSSLAVVAGVLAATACKSNPETEAALASLNDPRMRCVQTELTRKGYDVDRSFRRPGRLLATRLFSAGSPYRAAITAQIDSTDNALEVWTRVIRRDESPVVSAALMPSSTMMADAMEVEGVCERSR